MDEKLEALARCMDHTIPTAERVYQHHKEKSLHDPASLIRKVMGLSSAQQWEEYAKFTSSKSAVDPPVVRKQPHRAAKLATPTVVQPNLAAVPLGPQTTPTGSTSARPVPAIPPIVLHRTDDRGWAIHDDTESPQDAEEEMDVNIILGIERFLFPIRFI